jgi:hypothetical protein
MPLKVEFTSPASYAPSSTQTSWSSSTHSVMNPSHSQQFNASVGGFSSGPFTTALSGPYPPANQPLMLTQPFQGSIQQSLSGPTTGTVMQDPGTVFNSPAPQGSTAMTHPSGNLTSFQTVQSQPTLHHSSIIMQNPQQLQSPSQAPASSPPPPPPPSYTSTFERGLLLPQSGWQPSAGGRPGDMRTPTLLLPGPPSKAVVDQICGSERKATTVNVGNIPLWVTETDLKDFFSGCGTILDVSLERNPSASHLSADITFDSMKGANKAIQNGMNSSHFIVGDSASERERAHEREHVPRTNEELALEVEIPATGSVDVVDCASIHEGLGRSSRRLPRVQDRSGSIAAALAELATLDLPPPEVLYCIADEKSETANTSASTVPPATATMVPAPEPGTPVAVVAAPPSTTVTATATTSTAAGLLPAPAATPAPTRASRLPLVVRLVRNP